MSKYSSLFLSTLLLLVLISCGNNKNQQPDESMNNNAATQLNASVSRTDWGQHDGKKVYLYTLTNSKGTQVKITNYGGIITSWITNDKHGKKSDIVLGFNTLEEYQAPPPFFGATIGRYGNRIADGKFSLDGKTYTLATNNGPNNLHGGNKGFDKVVWDTVAVVGDETAIAFTYLSKDGEEGFPGNLNVRVKFTLTPDDELKIVYDAETDKATPVNLTNHSYFNLTGDVNNTILDHTLTIDADKYTPVDTTLIPTGELKAVAGTPFDFRTPKKIGADIDRVEGGYDHNFVLNGKDDAMKLASVLTEPTTGRKLETYSTEPGLQFYTGNFLDGTLHTSDGKTIKKHTGLCLETQHFPDSPNQPAFPSTILQPGEKYHTETTYKVSVL